MADKRTGKHMKKERTVQKSADNLDSLFQTFKGIKRAEGKAKGTLAIYIS
ncbi:hypothetical protein [Bacillus sp. UNC41MFS5]|nr:hypothetical protein [Bacillus sp. UNC41MFS5]